MVTGYMQTCDILVIVRKKEKQTSKTHTSLYRGDSLCPAVFCIAVLFQQYNRNETSATTRRIDAHLVSTLLGKPTSSARKLSLFVYSCLILSERRIMRIQINIEVSADEFETAQKLISTVKYAVLSL